MASRRLHFFVPIGIIALLLMASVGVQAQNTKGDRPAQAQRSIFRLPKIKGKKKGGDRAYTGDISGRRRIRTRNKSSAQRATQTGPLPFANRRPSGDRAARPIQNVKIKSSSAKMARNNVYPNRGPFVHNPVRKPSTKEGSRFGNAPRHRVRSRTAQASRNNVYPNRGPYVNNPSRKPHDPQGRFRGGGGAFSNFLSRTIIQPFRGNGAPSASGNYITRGRKNVYWGKFSKGEKPFTRDITGRPLRSKNYHTPFLGIIPTKDPYKGRRPSGDRAISGGRYQSARKAERPWNGNISGNPLRFLRPRTSQQVGDGKYSNNISISGRGRRNRPLPSSGLERSRRGKIFSGPIQGRAPGAGAGGFERFLGRFKGVKPMKGGGSTGGRIFNNKGQPIQGKTPGLGASGFERFLGRFNGVKPLKGGGSTGGRIFNNNGQPIQGKTPGLGASGFESFLAKFKGKKPLKGGGSTGAIIFNNKGQPIQVREPKFGLDVGAYRGNMRRGAKAFNTDGYDFSGNMKGARPLRGGGSISGNPRNNRYQPIQVREPKFGMDVGAYRGNMRRGPKAFNTDGYGFSGNLKGSRPLKGGGSISGRSRNNGFQAIQVREPKFGFDVGAYKGNIRRGPKAFNTDGYGFSGNLKGSRPLKGGGSISGRPRNNGFQAIQVREPKFGVDVGAYSGNIRKGPKTFSTDGYDYSGTMKARRPLKGGGSISGRPRNNDGKPVAVREPKFGVDVGAFSGRIKAHKPLKGGGSVSGKLWNNNESPIQGDGFSSRDKANSRYQGDMKQSLFKKQFTKNPNANKLALKKHTPDKSTYQVDGLQIKSKEFAHGKNKSSAKAAIDVRIAKSTTVKASEFMGKMKMWSHAHNPRSSKLALDVRYPGKAIARLKDYQGNQRMSKPHGKNLHPDAAFAHSHRDNVKHERTIFMNVKLAWSKLFRRGATQTTAVKEKVRKPRYDKKEKELWKDLYD